MTKLFKNLSLVALAAIAVSSCSDYNPYQGSVAELQYIKNFESKFGKVDPEQDWSMATQVVAAMNVPSIKGSATVYVYDGTPNVPTVHILAEASMNNGKAQFKFDALKDVVSVYIAVIQNGESVFSGTFAVSNGVLAIGEVSDMLGEMGVGSAYTRAFSPSCPTQINDTKEDLFTGIASDVQKYSYNGQYYTLSELRTWAKTEYEAGRVTVDNYLTTTPFTSSCFVDGTYDFSQATLKNSVSGPAAEEGYIYNGVYYANITALRNWAAGLPDVTTSNYGEKTPFTNSCVVSAGYDYSNPQPNTENSNLVVVDHHYYRAWLNNQWVEFADMKEIIAWSKENETWFSQWNLGSSVFKNLTWDSENNCVDYSNATINTDNVKEVNVGDYIYQGTIYDMQGLINWTKGNEDYIQNNGPLKNVYFPERLDFTNAVVDESQVTKVPAGSYIYQGTVYASLDALQVYTTTNKLGNNGPFDNCCSASSLDFTNAVVDETKAPLTTITFDIDLTYLKNVETASATPWTRGWGYSLYGPKAFFEEQQYYYGKNGKSEDKYNTLYGSTEKEKRAMLDKIEAGFKITSKGGVIELPFVYGATQIIDQFGYVFYKDGEDPLQQPHYVLMEDGRPDVNLYLDQWYAGEAKGWTGTSMSTWISGLTAYADAKGNPMNCYCNPGGGIWSCAHGSGAEHVDNCPKKSDESATCTCNPGTGIYSSTTAGHLPSCNDPMKAYLNQYNQKCYGTKYRLVYFNADGTATYNIPAGLNIVFFICPVATVADLKSRTNYQTNNFMYSLPELNKRINHLYFNTESPSFESGNNVSGDPKARGAVKACAWKQDGMTFLGFEDGGNDEDLNDIVFWVEGEFETTNIVELYPVKWHMNPNGMHDTTDGDLYTFSSYKTRDGYSQPATNPSREGYTFKGWSTTPTGTPISGSTEPGTTSQITGTMGTEGICYYAIWEPVSNVIPTTYVVKWHKNYSMTGHLTDDSDLYAVNSELSNGATYQQPGGTPSATDKVFIGWSKTYNNADGDASLTVSGTIDGADICYFAIWQNPVINYQSWIFACEDLGGIYDYDFNDVVWEVKRTTNEGVTSTKVRLLAAGGTLPFTLYYDNQKICTKEDAFGNGSNGTPINAGNGTTTKAVTEYNITDQDWSVVDNYRKFKVAVHQNQDEVTWVTAYNKENTKTNNTPQIIILPGEWEWPTEETPINTAYPSFNTWVTNGSAASWSDWQAKKVSGKTCKYQ